MDGRSEVEPGSVDDPWSSYSSRRLETVATALTFVLIYLLTNEVIAAVAISVVVYAYLHEQLSEDDEDEGGAHRSGMETDEVEETAAFAGGLVDGPEGEVVATTDDAGVSARYDVVVTSPHPVEVELERSDLSEAIGWLKGVLESLSLERLSEHGALADPPVRVTEEVKRRVRNDLDRRNLSGGFGEDGGKVGVAYVDADDDYDRYRYRVSYLGGRLN